MKKIIILLILLVFLTACAQKGVQEVSNMKITSPAFNHNENIPSKYTCDGENISPPLKFSEVPKDTKILALIMDDPDAPVGTFVHWIIWNTPATTTEIKEGEGISYPQGSNDFGKQRYGGPCPPSGTHRYFFKLYALDTELNLQPGATKQDLLEAMEGHIIEKAELIGKYSRS